MVKDGLISEIKLTTCRWVKWWKDWWKDGWKDGWSLMVKDMAMCSSWTDNVVCGEIV